MKDVMSKENNDTPMLFPYDPEKYWQMLRQIIQEEIISLQKQRSFANEFLMPELSNRPLLKIVDVCSMFHITKPTIYEWVKVGKLKPLKIRSRVYFLNEDIQQLLQTGQVKGT